jgi:hypothetical protein
MWKPELSRSGRALHNNRTGPARHRRLGHFADGLDMKIAPICIHNFAESLGVQKAEVVGHDIGLMVAFRRRTLGANQNNPRD